MMATTARKEEPRRSAIELPKGEVDGNRRAFVSEKSLVTVQLVEMIDADEGGQKPVTTDLGECPLGTREIYTQHRLCGDFYCFIHGNRQVSAVGPTLTEAFQNALAKAA